MSLLRGAKALALGLSCLSPVAGAAKTTNSIEIASQDMVEAIARLGAETGRQIVSPDELIAGRSSVAVQGQMAPREALVRMLNDNTLRVTELSDGTLVVSSAGPVDFVSQDTTEEEFFLGTIFLTTARRTLENVEDVPAQVIVFDQNTLDESNISDFSDAIEYLPNVNIATNSDPRRGYYSIRGVSSLNIAATSPTVGVFQNGVLQNSTGLRFNINPSLRDLERVEVLYGPQGTAYGRGTIGGAVNYVTAKPTFEQEGSITLSFNDQDELDGELVLNTPLTDTLAFRAVFYGTDVPGFIAAPNAPETDSIGSRNSGGRLSLRWQPNDQLTVDLSYQYDRSSYDGSFAANAASVLAGAPAQLSNTVPGIDIRRRNFTLNAEYETTFGTFISTTGSLTSDLFGIEDFDLGINPGSVLGRDSFEDTFSQEFRFESQDFNVGVGQISFNVGLSFSDISAETQSDFRTADFAGFGPGSANTVFNREVENRSIFADVRWQPTDNLEITVGARYSEDKISVRSRAITAGSLALLLPTSDQTQSNTYSGFTPSISVNYNWTQNFSVYASYSTGYKPGGFANQGATLAEFFEEDVENFEVGFRANFFDDRLKVATSIYQLDYTNIQVPLRIDVANGFFGGVENAAGARSRGAELSITANPLPGLTIAAAYGYTEAFFTDYRGSTNGDLTGAPLPNAPEHSYSLIVDYEFEERANGITPFLRAELTGKSGYNSEATSTSSVGDYDLVNLRIGVRNDDFTVSAFAENLFDEIYAVDSFSGNLVPGKPRTIGIVGTFRF